MDITTNKTRTAISIEEFSSTLTTIELYVIGIIMSSICVITIVGNALVLISFIMDKNLRTLTNYFILSLAVSDLMIATFSMPLFIAYLLEGEWTLGPVVCQIWLSQDYTCSTASNLNLLMIGFDRYFSVTNPLKYRAKKTGKRVGIMIGIVWAIAFLLWPSWIYAWPYIEGRVTVPEDDCYIQFLETNSYVTIITAVIDYYIPVSIMFVLYYKIWRETKRRNKYLADMDNGCMSESLCLQKKVSFDEDSKRKLPWKMRFVNKSKCDYPHNDSNADDEKNKDTAVALLKSSTDKDNHDNEIQSGECDIIECDNTDVQRPPDFHTACVDNSSSSMKTTESNMTCNSKKATNKNDNKAARVLTAILLAFIATATPYNVIILIKNLDVSQTIVPDSVYNFAYFLFYINSTLNPLCYALASENFRKTYWQILTCSWSQKSQYKVPVGYSGKSTQSKSSCNSKIVISSL